MPRTLEKLSAVAVTKRTEAGRLSDGGGLYLNVSPSGSKSWLFMWNVGKKRFEMGLGGYPAISLKAARSKAAECRTAVAEGRNPLEERKREQRKTFGEAAEAFIASMEKSWRNEKHKDQWRQTLGIEVEGVKRKISYCASLGDKPVADITTEDVLEVIEPIWATKSETASRLRGRIEQVLDYARVNKWREGENPARWRGHLKHRLAPRKKLAARGHHPAMDYKDVPAFMASLRQREAMAARALEFLILTAARSGEVLGAEWREIDLDNALWTVPKGRMKGGEEHAVPLSGAAVDLLRPLYENRVSDYVFPGNVTVKRKGKGVNPRLSSMSMEMLLRRMGFDAVTVHGFRSSFRDWAGDETEFPREVAEAALAHKIGNDVERAYRRSKALEKRRLLMEAWASYCAGAAMASNVVQLRG
jgi:integrase